MRITIACVRANSHVNCYINAHYPRAIYYALKFLKIERHANVDSIPLLYGYCYMQFVQYLSWQSIRC